MYGYFSSEFSGKNTKAPESVTQIKLSEYYAAYESYMADFGDDSVKSIEETISEVEQ